MDANESPRFTDSKGRVWSLAVDDAVRARLAAADVSLSKVRYLADYELIVKCLWLIVEPQAAERGVSEENFWEGLDGDAISRGFSALGGKFPEMDDEEIAVFADAISNAFVKSSRRLKLAKLKAEALNVPCDGNFLSKTSSVDPAFADAQGGIWRVEPFTRVVYLRLEAAGTLPSPHSEGYREALADFFEAVQGSATVFANVMAMVCQDERDERDVGSQTFLAILRDPDTLRRARQAWLAAYHEEFESPDADSEAEGE